MLLERVRTLFLSSVLSCVLALGATPTAQAPSDDARAVRRALDAYSEGIVRGDRGAIEALLDDRFVITSGDGALRDKRAELADLFPGPELVVHEFEIDDLEIRVFDRAAVATGILRWKMTYRKQPSAIERRTTVMLIRSGSAWRIVGQHVSRIAKPAAPPPGE